MKKVIFTLFAAVLVAPLLGAISREAMDMRQMQPGPGVMVNDVVRSLAGTWTGVGTMRDMKTNQDLPWMDNVSTQSTLNDKFVLMEASSIPDASGKIYQGKGFLTFNPAKDKYEMYWFDTMGFGGKFEGQKQGNIIMLRHQDMNGPRMTVTFTLVNANEYRMSIQSRRGHQVIPMMNVTYTKAGAQAPPPEQPVKESVPYGY